MKNIITALLLIFSFSLPAQEIAGIWKSVDDEDGKEKSHIQITESNGVLSAKIIKLLEAAESDTCDNCSGDLKGQPIVGMEILWDMQKQKNGSYDDGDIFNPKNGKTYSCSIRFEDKDTLRIRGYIGFSLLGKTQYWYRVK